MYLDGLATPQPLIAPPPAASQPQGLADQTGPRPLFSFGNADPRWLVIGAGLLLIVALWPCIRRNLR